MIGIIDYGAGNLGSVQKAFTYLNVPHRVIRSTAELDEVTAVVLPGVGAFGAAVAKLQSKGFFDALKTYIAAGRPFLGICLGMQLLMESSEESPGVPGLGVFNGVCRRFQHGKVPLIGWRPVAAQDNSRLFHGVPDNASFYFVHSYYVETTDPTTQAAVTDYHGPFTSAIEYKNICALQFHPEKSGEDGLKILKNFASASHPAARGAVKGSPCSSVFVRGKKTIDNKQLAKRIIPCLDVDNGRVVKGVKFEGIRDAGDPAELARMYNQQGADEITFLDIGATYKSRQILLDIVQKISRQIFVPLTVGGGISSVEDMRTALNTGADKISICSAAIHNPNLLTQGAQRFGSQCIVLSIDAKKTGNTWHAYLNGGRKDSGIDAVQWAQKAEKLGAGEILLNSIDCDGTQQGYDLQLTRRISETVNIPVIASGGAGTIQHMTEAVTQGKADAVLLASLLHDGDMNIPQIKTYLKTKGVNVR